MINQLGLVRALYRQFGRLPESMRHFIVGLTTPIHRVGTSAVIVHDDRILLCRHSYRQGWAIPGGMVGREETPAECVLREVREEVNLRVKTVGEPYVYVSHKPRRVEFVFDIALITGEPAEAAVASSPEIEEVRWFPRNDLPETSRRSLEVLLWTDDLRKARQAAGDILD